MKTRLPWRLWAPLLAFCGAASAQNLVANGGFAADLSGWHVANDERSNAAWSPADAAGDSGSGSAAVTDTSSTAGSLETPLQQCVTVVPGATYTLSSRFLFPSGSNTGFGEAYVRWRTAPHGGYYCGDSDLESAPPESIVIDSRTVAADAWIGVSKTFTAPAGIARAWVNVGSDCLQGSSSWMIHVDDVALVPAAGPSGDLAGILTGAGSLQGAGGANFKTAAQISNWADSAVDVRLVWHPAGLPASPGDPEFSIHLLAGQTVSTDDIVAAMGQSGLGSVDVHSTPGQPHPVIIARVYADAGDAGTTGYVEEMIDASAFPGSPGNGLLLAPSDLARYRYHIGIRTLDHPVSVSITVKDASGQIVRSFTDVYPANYYVQKTAVDFLGGFDVANDDAIWISFSGGGAIVYGATTDNVTNDPSIQFLPSLGG